MGSSSWIYATSVTTLLMFLIVGITARPRLVNFIAKKWPSYSGRRATLMRRSSNGIRTWLALLRLLTKKPSSRSYWRYIDAIPFQTWPSPVVAP